VTAGETHQAIEATFRIERARLIGGLARMVRNVDLAEELAHSESSSVFEFLPFRQRTLATSRS
jgi:predicted RNA polymerase sigma factor